MEFGTVQQLKALKEMVKYVITHDNKGMNIKPKIESHGKSKCLRTVTFVATERIGRALQVL